MFHRLISILDPNTRRRLRRFGKIKRAKWSLVLLSLIFVISLFSNFLANDKPLMVKCEGSLYFPVVKFYPDDVFTGSGRMTRARYKTLESSALFSENDNNWMWWPLFRYGPNESLRASDIEIDETLTITLKKASRVATLDVDSKLFIQRSRNAVSFYEATSEGSLRRQAMETDAMPVPDAIKAAIADRFANNAAPAIKKVSGRKNVAYSLGSFSPRSRPPKLVRVTLREADEAGDAQTGVLNKEMQFEGTAPALWRDLEEKDKTAILDRARESLVVQVENLNLDTKQGRITVNIKRETVSFPFRPVKGHSLGLDESGRDVLVLILYGTRIALLFALALVIFTSLIGIFLGAIQGYFGGKIDMIGQRLTEIWSAMPFLFIMILLSSIYGRSFFLLWFVSALFNWIGMSIYMRAEFLRLRKLPFVESARVMGIGRWKIMFRSILPNALVPVITFFPFELVGNIFILTSLDFLGFGLAPGTPSWGNLLDQGRIFPYGWWLVLYPAIALLVVSLLGIFIGEGVRAAFDPRNESKLE